ncbi:hypothetical protein IWW39_001419 [Coemansia spiralis]|uniref:Eukaryotic translation initiation factor 3 subunit D n=1 Tax=Coemansia spiralis TaxID=417178 RepID=A0A9W8GMS9_9FUNG|nr:hypothetical protein IWW39_001419 [Coemansia spiralis]
MSELPSFTLPTVFDNPKGWGPSNTQQAKDVRDIPYIPFSKGDKINRIANWISPADARDQRDGRNRGRRDMVQQTYGSNSASAFVFQAEADEESFSLVDNRGTAVKKIAVRAVHGTRGGARGRGRGGMQRLGYAGRGGKFGGAGGFRKRLGWRDYEREQHHRYASVKPTEEWELVQDIEFSRMRDLSFSVREPQDVGFYGQVGVYDQGYDRVNTRLERPLKVSGSVRYNATASEDPVLSKLAAKAGDVRVFATDSVIATLMASTVSMSAWDVVVNRVGDKLFFDKRDGGPLDFPSVNENAQVPPAEANEKEPASINTASMLAVEARDATFNYIKQVTEQSTISYENANPFNEQNEAGEPSDDNAYRYRLFDLSARAPKADIYDDEEEEVVIGERCLMAIRTEVDGVVVSGQSRKQMFIRALTQHDISAVGAGKALDWRQKLDSQRGAVVATEMKNNATKLARWAFQAVLAGADQLKVGFVARVSPRDRSRHGVLGFQTYRPSDFISQLGFSEYSGWGIVKALVDLCLEMPEGRYVIMRDPNKPLIKLYAVPAGTFEDNGEDDAEVAAAEDN